MKEENPFVDVSVIIAAYNIQDYIYNAVMSALAQEGVSIEVIVSDDNSSDGTVKTVLGIQDPRLKILTSDVNGGAGRSRNKAIAAATGKWIAILDADDAFAPGRLARMLKIANDHQAQMVVDNLKVFREEDKRQFAMFPPKKFNQLGVLTLPVLMRAKLGLQKGYPLGYLKPVILRDFLIQKKIAYDPDLRIGEDYILMAEILASGAVCAIDPLEGYIYTARSGSTSHRMSVKDVELEINAEDKFKSRYQLSGSNLSAYRRRMFFMRERLVYTKIVEALKKRNFRAAVKLSFGFPSALRHFWESIFVRLKRLYPKK